ncbi:MAG: class I SAM-dependent methyltransferase [Gemmiger sp.]|nr:class I SAM-dependent methyltransferase [Gemmiger sp.]
MPYNEFAYFYDEFNGAADYDALFRYIQKELAGQGITQGILADLGCGTGDLTLMLTQAGYDVIGIDLSEEMLSVLRDKADELGVSGQLLLLRQDILSLELYGTIRAAVSTFDTFNHIGPAKNFEKAVANAAFFMEKGGVFLFDLNTPYKHKEVLGDHTFDFDAPDASCHWQNHYDPEAGRVDIQIDIHDKEANEDYHERFPEYTYPLPYVEEVLARYGFRLARVADGEDFGPCRPDSQRWIFTAVKQYTQEMA